MTIYEKLSIGLSIIAILIPIIQSIYKKYWLKPDLKFYPTGRAYLFTNRSGSYIRIDGVYEALKSPISVKKISVKVVREKDSAALNLSWSSFYNPVNQQIMGAIASTTEIAHPFRIDADNVICAFTEFTDLFDSSEKTLKPYFEAIQSDLRGMDLSTKTYDEAYKCFVESKNYERAREALLKECFWSIGRYKAKINVEYCKLQKEFCIEFDVSKECRDALESNIKESINSFLKNIYNLRYDFKTVQVEIKEIE